MSARAASSRPTVGLLLDWLEGEYQNEIFGGAAEAARDNDVNLICFTGGVLNAPRRFWAGRNAAFELVGPENVDAVIVTSTIANAVGTDSLVEYCRRFRPLPVCSIAIPMPDVPGITVDHARGFIEGVRHLIEEHGRRRLAFIRGPEASEEAEDRFVAFKDVLATAGLPVIPELIAAGDFLRATGATAVRRWAETGVKLDAVVAANDEMALGALEALGRLAMRVPEDVSVMGFDDSDESRFCVPALTTVRQPVRELGRRAVALALMQLGHGEVPPAVQLGSRFVARESCGCARRPHPLPESERTDRAQLPADSHPGRGWAERFSEAVRADLAGGAGGLLRRTAGDICAQVAGDEQRLGLVREVLSSVRVELRPSLVRGDAASCVRFEELFDDALSLVLDRMLVTESMKRVGLQRWSRAFAAASKAFLGTLDVPSLMNAVIDQLPRLQIPSCFLTLYEDPAAPADWARMLLACDAVTPGRRWPWLPSATSASGDGPRRFRARELIPADLQPARRTTFVLEPLYYRDEQQGYMMLELGPSDGAAYEGLRDEISGALRAAMQNERVAAERSRRHAMEKAEADGEKERLIVAGIQGLLTPRELLAGDVEVAMAICPAARPGGSTGGAIETSRGLHVWVAQANTDGLSGALTSFMMQSVILARVTQEDSVEPAEVLTAVRRVLERRAPSAPAATPHLTEVSLLDGRLGLAGRAEAAVLCRADGRCESLSETSAGPVLEEGDVLVLFSGALEALDAERRPFGRDRLERSIVELGRQPARSIRDGLVAVLKRWSAVQREDLVFAVVRKLPAADRV